MNKHLAKAIQSLLWFYRENPTDPVLGIIHKLVETGTERKEIQEEAEGPRLVLVTPGKEGQKVMDLPLTFLKNCDFTTLLKEGRPAHSMGYIVVEDQDPEEDQKAEDDNNDDTTSS